ncbi:EF-hand [Rhizoclosmatium globosum]|uniref:EF-hand n=1 Tax=Rhizoclosmatium globosum TaxID=329046 RepID=A0A1Y2CD29_9FUNG|nr:EF-hand [Rhizoclosmatium globosum]|eukprot:ORY44836.1 EF-hand [Rhizoclosmatium globosum]
MPPKPAPAKPAAKAAPLLLQPRKETPKKRLKRELQQPEKSSTSDSSNYLNIDPSLMQRTGLNSVQLQELIEIFSLVDVDHGGTISTDELGVLMNTLGLHPSQMELEAMVKELDSENTGEMILSVTFVGAMTKQLETEVTPDELTKAFKMFTLFDASNELIVPDHEGTMPRSLLVSILTSYGDLDKRMTTAEAEDLISSVAPHGSHTTFDYAQFIQMYFQIPSPIQKDKIKILHV